jgi:hypothetical protein
MQVSLQINALSYAVFATRGEISQSLYGMRPSACLPNVPTESSLLTNGLQVTLPTLPKKLVESLSKLGTQQVRQPANTSNL